MTGTMFRKGRNSNASYRTQTKKQKTNRGAGKEKKERRIRKLQDQNHKQEARAAKLETQTETCKCPKHRLLKKELGIRARKGGKKAPKSPLTKRKGGGRGESLIQELQSPSSELNTGLRRKEKGEARRRRHNGCGPLWQKKKTPRSYPNPKNGWGEKKNRRARWQCH